MHIPMYCALIRLNTLVITATATILRSNESKNHIFILKTRVPRY